MFALGVRALIALLFSIFLSSSSLASFGRCSELFQRAPQLQVQTGKLESHREERRFGEIDHKNNYQFEADLAADGTLSFAMFLSYPEFGVRSHMRGSVLYKEAVEHFGVENIQRIKDVWMEGTNFDGFFEARRQPGTTDEAAAQSTWSGKQAARFGFTRVEHISVTEAPMTGQITIIAIFTRPIL